MRLRSVVVFVLIAGLAGALILAADSHRLLRQTEALLNAGDSKLTREAIQALIRQSHIQSLGFLALALLFISAVLVFLLAGRDPETARDLSQPDRFSRAPQASQSVPGISHAVPPAVDPLPPPPVAPPTAPAPVPMPPDAVPETQGRSV